MMVVSRIAFAGLLAFLGGCANFGYYLQSVGGQFDVWRRERAIHELLDDPATPAALAEKLQRVSAIREFATRNLGLPENQSYRRYADVERPYIVWNVIATPEFSLQPVQWCFPVAGCVSYRGYFAQDGAERFAADLGRQGYDVFVGGVPAYSTLGWFADPVLNTFIHYPDYEIARLVFHELAHQVVYVRDDTVFNESFAVVVETAGVERWLAREGDARMKAAFDRRQRLREEFTRIVGSSRGRLDALYRLQLPAEEKRARKAAILRELYGDYNAIRKEWGGATAYDGWFASQPNNAQIVSVGLYSDLVPAFTALLEREGGDLARFYAAVKALARLPKDERTAALHALAPHKTVQ